MARFTVAPGDETQDELEKLFGKPNPSSTPRPAGDFTRVFFGLEPVPPKNPAEAPAGDSDLQSSAIRSYPRPASTPGEFTRVFGTLNADAQPRDSNAEERPQPAGQNGTPSSEPGSSTDLFAPSRQVPPNPINSQSDTFTSFFHSELPAVGPARPSSDFRHLSPSAGSAPSLGADERAGVLPGINIQNGERSREDIGTDFAPFAEPNQGHDPEKATRLFSLPKPTGDRPAPAGGPSAFTRVIASSALRSAEEKTDSSAAAGNSSSPQAAPALAFSAPAIAPQWPVGSMPAAPVHPAGYLPQQPIPPQMAMPPVAQVAWPQPPAVQVQPQSQIQSEEQTPQQKWVTYLPLIIGLNLLFFLAVVLILIFALSR